MDSATSCATASKACRPHLIAIAGPSCAGKTTLAQGLVKALPSAVHFPLDAYYADLSNLLPEQRVQHNFDRPDALDYDLLHADLQALANGQPIRAPVYDFRTHTRQPVTRTITPPKYLLIEGLFALSFPTLRALCSYRIYVDIDSITSLERRIRRDSIERDRPENSVRQQFKLQVEPMTQRYIVPTQSHADCIVSGAHTPAALCAQIQQATSHLK